MGITSIYVTHDQVEAMTMADRIAVMSAGVLQAFDTPADLYDRPKTLFVAGFVGNPPMNFFDVEVRGSDDGLRAQNGALDLAVADVRGEAAAAYEGKVVMGIRPEDISLSDGSEAGASIQSLRSEVIGLEPLGREDLVAARINDVEFHFLVDKAKSVRLGDTIDVALDMGSVQFFDPETESSLLWA